jgi:hypothetical protein
VIDQTSGWRITLKTNPGPRLSQRRGLTFAGFGSFYRSLWRSLLRGGVVRLHASERLFHFPEHPNRGYQIRRTIAFEPRDQLSLTLNTSPLVENIRLADLDRRLGLCGRVGHVI